MNLQDLDKAVLKSLISEIFQENPQLLFDAVEKYLDATASPDEKKIRRNKMIALINKNYDKYDDVFKALA